MRFSLRGMLMLTALIATTLWGTSALGRHDAALFGIVLMLWVATAFLAGWYARGSSVRVGFQWLPIAAGLLINWALWFCMSYLLGVIVDPETELIGDIPAGFELLMDAQRLHIFLYLAVLLSVLMLLAQWKRRSWATACLVACLSVWGFLYWWGFINASAALIGVD